MSNELKTELVTECFVCVQGHVPLTFSFLSFFFLIGWEFYGPYYLQVKTCALGRQRPFSPSVPAEVGCLFAVATCVHVFISGESLHCFLVGVNKSYVTATADL